MAGDLLADKVPGINWKSIKREAESLYEGVGEEAKELAGVGAGERDHENGMKGLKNRFQSSNDRDDMLELLERSYGVVRDGLNNKDRDSIKEALTSRTGVSKEEAEKTLEKWEETYAEAKQQYQHIAKRAEQTARESADVATTAVSRIAVWTFASLMCGMFVAGLGGYTGSRYFGGL